jgi:hypothetical protein
MQDSYSFPQVRARLAEGAIKQLGREGIVRRLVGLGYVPGPSDGAASVRALAYRLAWRLLPAGALYVEPAAADLSCNAALSRADARAARKGGA